MGIVWGILTALGFGSADFLARGASVRLGAYRAFLYTQAISGLLLIVIVFLNPSVTTLSIPMLALAAALGVLNIIGVLLLYRALTIGRLAIVSPIASAFAAVTLGLSILTGDPISLEKIAGLLLMVVGVLLVSSSPSDPADSIAAQRTVRGVPEALGCALALGVMFWGLKYVVPSLGPWVPVLAGRVMALLLLPLLAIPLRQSIAWPAQVAWPSLLAIGVLDTAANVSYNIGLGSDAPGVVAVLGSLFSPITVLLAYIFLHERLARWQWVGVGIIFVAIALIAIAANG